MHVCSDLHHFVFTIHAKETVWECIPPAQSERSTRQPPAVRFFLRPLPLTRHLQAVRLRLLEHVTTQEIA
jgi:hypothetical protein